MALQILELLRGAWPWYVSGPLIGLFVPLLLVLGNRQLGVSSSLRAVCAAVAPGPVEFFRYDWKKSGLWNIAFVLGIALGGMLVSATGAAGTPAIAEATQLAIGKLHLSRASGLVPSDVFNWSALLTIRGFISMVVGGFLVGFGASYAGGCTSGHGIMGLATLQKASVVALVGMFAGGLLATFIVLPAIL